MLKSPQQLAADLNANLKRYSSEPITHSAAFASDEIALSTATSATVTEAYEALRKQVSEFLDRPQNRGFVLTRFLVSAELNVDQTRLRLLARAGFTKDLRS